MDWSYIAGYFDGEGHVEKRAYGISFANSHRESLEAIRTFMGHGIIEGRPGTNKPVYHLRIRNLTALRIVVPELIAYAIVKRAELEALLARTQHLTAVPNHGRLAAVGVDELRRLYWDEGLSCPTIAKRYGVHPVSVEQFLRRNGGVRTRAEAMKLLGEQGLRRGRFSSGGFPMDGVDPETIRALYWNDGMSAAAIGMLYGLGREGMRAYMLRHNIPFRPRGRHPRRSLTRDLGP